MSAAASIDPVDLDGLRARIRAIEGGGMATGREVARLGTALDGCLPWGGLPTAALHEIGGPAANAVTAAMARRFLDRKGALVWCRSDSLAWLQGELYGPSLKPYSIDPARLLYVRARDAAETLLAATMAMRSNAVACTVMEIEELDLVSSRKLQLAVEMGGGVGLILRHSVLDASPNSALTRFWAEPLAPAVQGESDAIEEAPWRAPRRGSRFRLSLWRAKGASPNFWTVAWNERTLAFDLAPGLVDRAPDPARRPAWPERRHHLACAF